MTSVDKPIRKAATVLVLRQGDGDIEVFMVQRPGRGVFPNLHVFPGGKVDGADTGLGHLCHRLSDDEASAQLGVANGGLRYWVTAIRECFEESGVLLAYRRGALFQPNGETELARFEDYRNALIAGETDLPAVAQREGLQLATDRVSYFSHWITPPSAPARFDTRFFVAAMPPGQSAQAHRQETVAGSWVTPKQALANFDAGGWQMIHPTLTSLRTVARYSSLETIMGAVAAGTHIRRVDDALHEQGMQRDSPGVAAG